MFRTPEERREYWQNKREEKWIYSWENQIIALIVRFGKKGISEEEILYKICKIRKISYQTVKKDLKTFKRWIKKFNYDFVRYDKKNKVFYLTEKYWDHNTNDLILEICNCETSTICECNHCKYE